MAAKGSGADGCLRGVRGRSAYAAEPVAALYEQGRVRHVAAGLEALEEELMGLADALVWAVTDLLIDGAEMGPRVRVV